MAKEMSIRTGVMPNASQVFPVARELVAKHAAEALSLADERIAACLRQGHRDAAEVWREIAAAIAEILVDT
jgi:hypothetical protein